MAIKPAGLLYAILQICKENGACKDLAEYFSLFWSVWGKCRPSPPTMRHRGEVDIYSIPVLVCCATRVKEGHDQTHCMLRSRAARSQA